MVWISVLFWLKLVGVNFNFVFCSICKILLYNIFLLLMIFLFVVYGFGKDSFRVLDIRILNVFFLVLFVNKDF